MSQPFEPHISPRQKVRELTFRALVLGLILGFLFAVANAYLALKVGQTVSASIPAAIMSMGLMKMFFKDATILENNIVQTIATVGEGLAGGVVFTVPALIFLGDAPSIGRIFLLSALGGILGILFMIPMRRFIIVEEHGRLPFPEGTACAEILKAGETKQGFAIMALWGVIASAVYKVCMSIFFLWKEIPVWTFAFYHRAVFSIDATPALLGVGYLIGPRIAGLMFAGGLIAWWTIIPLIKMFGFEGAMIYPSHVPIMDMTSDAIWNNYVRYIGAGTVAVGGLVSLFRVIPLLHRTIHVSLKELLGEYKERKQLPRTDQDISMAWLLLGAVAIILSLWLFPGLPMNFFTIVLLVVLSFFFVAITSLSVGLVGSSSNPVSGMTITTLLVTCAIFILLSWTERMYLISAITMGSVACVAICLAATTSQDLKTGFLLGATPKAQQIAEILGLIIPSIALGYTLYVLNQAYIIGSTALPAPQAVLISLIAEGVIHGHLPYALIGVGLFMGLAMAFLRVPILPFALGLYLPLSLTAAIMVGGLVREWVDYKNQGESEKKGVLLASGLIGGDAVMGIVIAGLTVTGVIPIDNPPFFDNWMSLFLFLLLGVLLAHFSRIRSTDSKI